MAGIWDCMGWWWWWLENSAELDLLILLFILDLQATSWQCSELTADWGTVWIVGIEPGPLPSLLCCPPTQMFVLFKADLRAVRVSVGPCGRMPQDE